MRHPLLSGTAFAILVALALWGCSGGASPAAPGPATVTVAAT